ncbi:MAG: DUF1508 domain-containing protein [Bacteroidota bacterium]
MKFQMLQDRSTGIFSFELLNDQNQPIFSSVQTYADREGSTAAMTATIEALRNEGQIQMEGLNARILDPAANVLMESIAFPDEASRDAEIGSIRSTAANNEDIEVTLTTVTTQRRSLGFETVDYAALYDFSQTSRSNEPGFDPFQYEADEKFYFLFNGANGQPILFSRSFPSISKRNARIRQIIKSAGRTNRFEQKPTEDGQVYFIVKASNGTEIGRSRNFASAAEAEAAIAYLMAEAPTFASQYPEPAKRKRNVNNEYEFDHASATGEQGFEAYRSDQNKLYYFHFNDAAGQPVIFSEGYSSGRSRDNGIKSVIKNGGLEDRYEIKEANGQYYISLRAGNRQEIARSRSFPEKQTVEGLVGKLIALIPIYAEKYGVVLERTQDTENFALSVGIQAAEPIQVFDDYDLSATSVSGKSGFESFYSDKNRGYFFHFNDPDGNALFFSEGYTAEKSRDNGIRSVIKNSVADERFTPHEDEAGHFFSLKAGNHQEIGRSKYFESAAAMSPWILWFKENVHSYAEQFGVDGLVVPPIYAGSMDEGQTNDPGPILPLSTPTDTDDPNPAGEPAPPEDTPAEGSTGETDTPTTLESTSSDTDPTGKIGETTISTEDTPTEESTGETNTPTPLESASSDTDPIGDTTPQTEDTPAEGSTGETDTPTTLESASSDTDPTGETTPPTEDTPAEGSTGETDTPTPLESASSDTDPTGDTTPQTEDTPAEGSTGETDTPTPQEKEPLPLGVLAGAAGAYAGYLNWGDYQSQGGQPKTGFDTYHDPDTGQYYWVYLGENGQPLFLSQGYTSEKERDDAVVASMGRLSKDEHFQLYQAPEGYYYYQIQGADGQPVALSTPMETPEQARTKIGAFFSAAPALAFGGMVWDWMSGSTKAEAPASVAETPVRPEPTPVTQEAEPQPEKEPTTPSSSPKEPPKTESTPSSTPPSSSAPSASLDRESSGANRWWIWALLLLLLLLLLWWLLPNSCNRSGGAAGGDEIQGEKDPVENIEGTGVLADSMRRDSQHVETLDASSLNADQDSLSEEFEGAENESEGSYEEGNEGEGETDGEGGTSDESLSTDEASMEGEGSDRGNGGVMSETESDLGTSSDNKGASDQGSGENSMGASSDGLALLGPTAASLGIPAGTFAARIADFLSDPASKKQAETFTLLNAFDFDQHYLMEPGRSQIKRYLPKVLAAYPNATLVITGYAHPSENQEVPDSYDDPTGTKGLTISLPLLRARCIYRKLRDSQSQISTRRMKMETRVSDGFPASDTKSRRIEVTIQR